VHARHSTFRSFSGPHAPTAKVIPGVQTLHALHWVSRVSSQAAASYSFSAHAVQLAHTAAWVASHGRCSY
jgi:hypothetical protein